jgi:hypothetical protein
MVMILGSSRATAVPPSADINRRFPISIATRPALNWDHHRCKAGKNIMPQSAGLARCVSYGKVTIRSLSEASGHGASAANPSFLTQGVISRPTNDALRMAHSMTASSSHSERAGPQPAPRHS